MRSMKAKIMVALVTVAFAATGCSQTKEEKELDKAFDELDRCIDTAKTDAQLDSCMRWTK